MTLVVGILVCIVWLVPYPNNIGGKLLHADVKQYCK